MIVQNGQEWQTRIRDNPKVVAFFIHPKCGGCQAYEPTRQHFVKLWTEKKQKKQPVHFIVFDASLILQQPDLQPILAKYQVTHIPAILYLENQELKGKLEHRKYSGIESWIQKRFHPEQKLPEMLAVCAVYELNKWWHGGIQTPATPSIEQRKKRQLFDFLIENYENPYLDTSMLKSFVPLVFGGDKIPTNDDRDSLCMEMYHFLLQTLAVD